MTNDQFFTVDGRPTVRIERRYPHSVEKVWRAVTTSEHLGAWFPSPVEVDLRAGGAMTFPAFAGDASASGTVEMVEPPRLLAFTWGTDRMTFELTPDGEGTLFELTHTFDDRAGAASFATGWEICLAGLRHVLADEPLPPPDRGIERHEELVHEFGLDRPEVTESDGRWTMRYERQLNCPAAVAWDLWFGIDRSTGEQRPAPAVGEPLTPYMAPDRVIGTMTASEEPHLLAFDVAPTGGPGEHVRVELNEGTGHGARVVLTVSGSDPAELDAAVAQWGGGAVGHLASEAAKWALSEVSPA
ncbi:MAG: SRPBCC domain-containing protein [Actinomycetota bacterium]|nr:SRPBCC domain-containing protein [Actinomycetota bacterium]